MSFGLFFHLHLGVIQKSGVRMEWSQLLLSSWYQLVPIPSLEIHSFYLLGAIS